MSTPRYIRTQNVGIVRYLYRTTRVFSLITLGVLIFGLIAAQERDVLAKPWLTAALTLFVVALVLLVLIMRDQRRAIGALETSEAQASPASPAPGSALVPAAATEPGGTTEGTAAATAPGPDAAAEPATDAQPAAAPSPAAAAAHVASVERGRITTTGAVVSVIWLVILVLMVWH